MSRPRAPLRAAALAATVLALGAPAAEAPRSVYRADGKASAEELRAADGTWIGRTAHTVYEFVPAGEFSPRGGRVLLVETFTKEERADREGASASLVVRALASGARPYDTEVWTFRTQASEAARTPWGAFLQTTRKGCCGAEDVHRLVDLENGREVAAFSGDFAFLGADARPLERVVSYLSMMADASAYGAARESVGVLTLAGRAGISDRVVISRSPREDMGTPRVLLVTPEDRDGSAFARLSGATKGRTARDVVRGVAVRLDWGGGLAASVPVAGDAFDPSRAELPKGFSVSRSPR